jgi:hypothetical protein
MNLLLPQLTNSIELSSITIPTTEVGLSLIDEMTMTDAPHQISLMMNSIRLLTQLLYHDPDTKISQASLEYLNSSGELTDSGILIATTNANGHTHLTISQEGGVVDGVSKIFQWIIAMIRRLVNAIVDYIKWAVSRNARYQAAIKQIQSKTAAAGGFMLNSGTRVTVLSFSEFYTLESITKQIVAWSKTLSPNDMAQKILNSPTMSKKGVFQEPTFSYLEATLLTKGWTKVNALGALKDALTLLQQTDEPRILEEKLSKPIKDYERAAIKIKDDKTISDIERDKLYMNVQAKLFECHLAVHAVTRLEGMIRKLATTAITVGRNLVPIV